MNRASRRAFGRPTRFEPCRGALTSAPIAFAGMPPKKKRAVQKGNEHAKKEAANAGTQVTCVTRCAPLVRK